MVDLSCLRLERLETASDDNTTVWRPSGLAIRCKDPMAASSTHGAPATFVITHNQCTTHITSKLHPEQPARVTSIISALRRIERRSLKGKGNAMFAPVDPAYIASGEEEEQAAEGEAERVDDPAAAAEANFQMIEMDSSPAMLATLEALLTSSSPTAGQPGLMRTG